VWDFFKPDHTVEYPTVDGKLSQVCYYQALEDVYQRFCDKLNTVSTNGKDYSVESHDYFVFHAPYNKLVQKSYGRLFLMDARRTHEKGTTTDDANENVLEQNEWLTKPIQETYNDRELEGTLKKLSASSYKVQLEDSNLASKLIGNTYTASVFIGLASLIDQAGGRGDLKPGKSIAVFSYGSGALATLYRLKV
jgi:hydroxymethylglutaryl-CoA synthase